MTRVGIINVTGYAGSELARILHNHPEVELTSITGRSAAGKQLSEVFPHLRTASMTITPEIEGSVDVVFSALPHAASAEKLKPFIDDGIPAIDISADFRLKDLATYESWYKVEHPCPNYIESAVYGLPELHRSKLKQTKLVANPGCYPTGTILGMAPAMRAGIVQTDVISDCKSGISGAGRSAKMEYGFSELNDNMSAYGLSGHRHQPEMAQELSGVSASGPVNVTFVPHLAPMTRGILGTHYAKLTRNVTQAEVTELYREFYADEPFVHVVPAPPATKETWGSNDCLIYPYVRVETGTLIVVSAIDNLVKGAAGAGVQNMNIMLGIEETLGLEGLPVYP
jgi:N-acetyl-gamma-glutamyl-phosphate reductase